MTDSPAHAINYPPLFGPLQLMNVQALVDATHEPWYSQTLIEIGGVLVRLGVMQGEFHWHKHEEQDQFFFVLDGEFHIELDGHDARHARSSRRLLRPGRHAPPAGRPGADRLVVPARRGMRSSRA